MTYAADGNSGLDEILTTTVGKGLGCDGIFIDTMDTTAPNSFSAALQFEWTQPGYRQLLQTVRAAYPGKLLVQNRATFFFNPEFEAYDFTTRPFVDVVMFESYYADSNDTDTFSPYFLDSKYRVGMKLSAEADRADGFFPIVEQDGFEKNLGYRFEKASGSVYDTDFVESQKVQGWALYQSDKFLCHSHFHAHGNNLYLDADRSLGTGFDPFGAGLLGSELLMQSDGLYSQKLGGWNDGTIASVAIAPYATAATSWEWRIPRDLVHPAGGGVVFSAPGGAFRLLVTSDNAGAAELAPTARTAVEIRYVPAP